MYTSLLRPLLFSLDPETSHNIAMKVLAWSAPLAPLVAPKFALNDERLHVEVAGLQFKNPIGLAAGIDKGCVAVKMLSALGPGHIELGGVTSKPQIGHPRPRIRRFVDRKALVNRMGFPSPGVHVIRDRLQREYAARQCVLGVNLGRTADVPQEDLASDYCFTFSMLQNIADYFVINVSCPNTSDAHALQEEGKLQEIVAAVMQANHQKRPIFVKISPDLSSEQIKAAVDVCLAHQLAGIIACNTTTSRTLVPEAREVAGGLSGRPVFERAREVVSFIYGYTGGQLPIIAVGGISHSEQAIAMLEAGASLLQVYTGLVYEGPGLIYRLNRGVLRFLEKRGIPSLQEYLNHRTLPNCAVISRSALV